MFKRIKKEIIWGGKKLSLETGQVARQANGSIILRSGDTVILATAVAAKKAKPEKCPSIYTLRASDRHLEVPSVLFVS